MATQPSDHFEEDFGPAERERVFLEQRLSLPESTRRAAQPQPETTTTGPEISTSQLLDTLPDNWYKDQMDAYRQRQQQQQLKRAVPGVRAAPPTGRLADSWIPLGPSIVDDQNGNLLVSGRATDIAIAPGQGANRQDRLYLASANGGVWRSDDSGQSWLSLMNAFDENPQTTKSDSLACGAIAIDPANPDVIYVGTGEGYTNITAYFGVGPVVSSDGGLNWQTEPVAAGSDALGGKGFYALILDPDDANVVLAATNIGLYRRQASGSGGYEWAQIPLDGVKNDRVTSVIVTRPATGGKVFFAAKGNGTTYRSSDGRAWAVFGNALPKIGNSKYDRVSLAAKPDDSQNIYALVNNGNSGPVYRFLGGQWQLIANGPTNYLGTQGFYDLELAVDPNDVSRIYIGGAGVDVPGPSKQKAALFRATVTLTAGAFSMAYENLGASLHVDLHRIRFQGNDSDNLWICCDGGLFHTTRATDINNPDTMFTPSNSGLATMTMMNMGRNSSSDALILCGTQDNGGQRYTASEVWRRISAGDSGFAAQSGRSIPAIKRSQIIFTYTHNEMKLFRAYGSDPNYTSRNVPIATGEDSEGYAPLVVAPASEILAFGSTRPWIGTGFGSTWESIPNNNATTDNLGSTITALTFYDQNKLYVGTSNGRVYRYDFNTATSLWRQSPLAALTGLGGIRINSIAIDYANSTGNAIYVALNATDWRRVWHYDAAWGWQQRSGPAQNDPATLLPVSVNALATDPRNPATLYAGLDIGVWRSQDGGKTWHTFSEGLPDAAVIDLLMDPSLPILRTSTHGRGVFERALDVFIFPQTHLYLRDSAADRGMYPSLAGVEDPSQPNSSGPVVKVDLNNSPDIKISTDPTLQAQIDFVQFYKAGDSSSGVSRSRAVRVYVQVHNHGTTTYIVDNVRVMLLMTREGFDTSAPMLPSDIDRYVRQGIALENASWTTLGMKTLNGVSATIPQVVSFDVDTNRLPTIDAQGCMVALVDQADDTFDSADGATVLELNSGTFVQQDPVDNFPGGGLTLTLWLRVNPGWPDTETAYVFIYDGGNANTRFYARNPTNLEVGFGARTTDPTNVQLHDGNWHHLAMTLTPADATHYQASIYKDGLLMFRSSGELGHTVANVLRAHQGLIIGSDVAPSDDAQFVGWMTEFCLWNGVLTEEQIQSRMYMRMASDTPDLALYLPLASPDTRVTKGAWLQANLLFHQSTVTATWDAVAGATYNFEITDGTGARVYWNERLTTNSLAFNTTSLENFMDYQARVQTVTSSGSTWSNQVELNVFNLPPPEVSLVYDTISNKLIAEWQVISGVSGYEVGLSGYNVLGETARTAQTLPVATTQWDLTTRLQDTTGTRLEVRGLRDQGSRSPASFTGLLGSAPVLSLTFTAETDATGKIRAGWIPARSDGADFYYLQVFNGNQPDPGHLNSQAQIPLDQTSADIAAAPHEGEAFTARIRPIGQGNIGLWGDNAVLVVHYLASPVVTMTEQADGSAIASWNDIRTPAQSGLSVSYEVAVYKDGAAQPDTPPLVIKAGDPRQYSIPAASVQAHAYQVLVRGFTVDNRTTSYGLWSAAAAVGTPVVRFYYDNASLHILLGFDEVTGASSYDVEVYAGDQITGAPIFHQSYTTAQQDFAILPGTALNPADQFTAHVRAYAGGAIGAWCVPVTIVVAQLDKPATVTFDVPAADGSLTANWTSPSGADGVELQLVPGDGSAPTIMSPPGTSHTFSQLLATSSTTYLVKVRAFTNQHSYSAWSDAALPAPSTLAFMYHVDTGEIIASWDMPTAGSKSFLQAFAGAVAQGAPFQQQGYDTAALSVVLTPPPPTGHTNITNGTAYNGRVRTMANGGVSTWANQGLIVHDFAAPAVTFRWVNPLSARWHAVTDTSSNAPTEYQVFAFPAGGGAPLFKELVAVVPGQADYSYTFTDSQKAQLLTAASAINIQVWAVGDNSVSALSAVPTLDAPSITTFTYTPSGAGGTFNAQWAAQSNAEYYYLVVDKDAISATSPASMITASVGASGSISMNAVSNLATYQASVKTLSGGAVTALSAALPLNVYQLPGPTNVQVTGQSPTLTVNYTFDRPAWLPQNVYDAIVYQATVTLEDKSTYSGNSQPGQKSLTITNAAFANNVGVSVQVRATTTTTASGVTTAAYGLYSDPPNGLIIGALAQVTNVIGTSTTEQVDIQWDYVAEALKYSLKICDSQDVNCTSLCTIPDATNSGNGRQGTTVGLSDCGALQMGKTYYIRVRALGADSRQGPWSEWASVTIKNSSSTNPDNNGNAGHDTDPVNVATGSYAYSNVDLVVPGVVPIQFTTFYATSTGLPSDEMPIPNVPMGNRWSHNYNAYLQIDNDNKQVAIFWWTGAISVYAIPSSQSGYYTLQGLPNGDSLYHDTSGRYTLTRKDQTIFRFTSTGQLYEIENPIGNRLLLTYSQNRLDKVQDQGSGHFIQFSYNSGQRIEHVTDNFGRSIGYEYYDNGDLKNYTDLGHNKRQFGYDSPSLLNNITDQNTHTLVANTYYHNPNRVHVQTDGRGSTTTFEYTTEQYNGRDAWKTTVTDRDNKQKTYYSDPNNGNLLELRQLLENGNLRRMIYTYDGFNNMLSETISEAPSGQPLRGNVTGFGYDGNNNLNAINLPTGDTFRVVYDARNRVTSVTDTNGNTITYLYDGSNLKTVTRPYNKTETYEYYDSTDFPTIRGLVKIQTDSNGNSVHYEYNPDGTVDKVTNALGNAVRMGYDTFGRPNRLTEQAGSDAATMLRETTLTYTAQGWVESRSVRFSGQTVAQAFTYAYEYDNLGNPTHVYALDNPTQFTLFEYDNNNNLYRTTFPAKGTEAPVQQIRSYYGGDQLHTYQRAPGIVETLAYDAFGRLTSIQDARLKTTDIAYAFVPHPSLAGVYHAQITTTLPPPDDTKPTERFSRVEVTDLLGRPVSYTDTDTSVTTYTYALQQDPDDPHAQRQLITTTLPLADSQQAQSYTIVETYDALGRLIARQNERGKTISYAYSLKHDAASNTYQMQLTITDPLNNTSVETYDALNRLVDYVVGTGNEQQRTAYQYDALGRLTQTTEYKTGGAQQTTTYTYEYVAASNTMRTNVKGPNSVTQPDSLEYDCTGKLVKASTPLGKTFRYSYKPNGLLDTAINGRGQSIIYGYDAAGRPESMQIPNNVTIKHVIDANGNRKQTMANDVVQIQREFDSWNRLSSRTDAGNNVVGYTYTPTNFVQTITYPDTTKTVRYEYDGLSRLKHVTDWHNQVTTYAYYPTGELQQTDLPDGSVVTYTYDDASELTGVTDTRGDRLLFRETYVPDSVGNRRTSEVILPLPPVVAARSDTTHFNDGNQIMDRNGSAAYTYDDDGNLVVYPGSAGEAQYDVFNQMTQYGSDVYAYDTDGFRTRTDVAGLTTQFVYDVGGYHNPMRDYADPRRKTVEATLYPHPAGGQVGLPTYGGLNLDPVMSDYGSLDRVLEERYADGNVLARYIHGLGLISREAADGTGYRVFHYDSRGSTIALTDSNGAITDRYAYNPFGELVNRAGQTPNNFCYNGRDGVRLDGDGLLYMRNRYFNGGLLSFMQQDILYGSAMQPQSFNRYSYVVGNPVSYIDPLGLSGGSDDSGSGGSKSGGQNFIDWVKNHIGAIIGTAAGLIGGGLLIYFSPEIAGFFGVTSEIFSGFQVEEAAGDFELDNLIGETETTTEEATLTEENASRVERPPTLTQRFAPRQARVLRRPTPRSQRILSQRITNPQRFARWQKGYNASPSWFSRNITRI